MKEQKNFKQRSEIQIENELSLLIGQDKETIQEYLDCLDIYEKEIAMRILCSQHPDTASLFWDCNAGHTAYPK